MSAVAVAPISLHWKSSVSSKSLAVPSRGRVEATAVRAPYSLDTETILVERCVAGEQAAWDELVKTYTKRVYAICYRFTGTDAEAQDLTQEVFVRVFRTLGSFRAGEGSFMVWLTRLTRNLLIDHYRRTKNDRVTDALEDKLPVLEERTAQISRTDGMLAGREAGELLQAALDQAVAGVA